MKINPSLGDAAKYATIEENEALNKMDRRVKTLSGWIRERDGLVEERERLIATVLGRAKAAIKVEE